MDSEPPVCTTTFKLNNGYTLPAVGLGSWQGSPGSDDEAALKSSIIHALKSGYRLIDTAQLYKTEDTVGAAIRESGIPRSEITVITKFWGESHHDVAGAFQRSLDALGLDYIDLFLMHWPWSMTPDGKPLKKEDQNPDFRQTWVAMQELVGPKCRGIGVSNFSQKTIDELLAHPDVKVVPAVNQVELHVFNPSLKLVPYHKEKGIVTMSWSTLGGPGDVGKEIRTHPLFKSIADAHSCSTGVVSLSWAVQRGIVVIPKSASFKRLEENIRLVTLTNEEMDKMNKASETIRKHRNADSSLRATIDGKTTLMGWTNVDMGWEDEEGNWLL